LPFSAPVSSYLVSYRVRFKHRWAFSSRNRPLSNADCNTGPGPQNARALLLERKLSIGSRRTVCPFVLVEAVVRRRRGIIGDGRIDDRPAIIDVDLGSREGLEVGGCSTEDAMVGASGVGGVGGGVERACPENHVLVLGGVPDCLRCPSENRGTLFSCRIWDG
jgi:hypothetical protein